MTEIIFAGFGGQGVLTAGLILINGAVGQGKNVTWTSSYGAEMRGGTASCSVVVSEEEIGSPYPIDIDVLVAMNEPSYNKFIGRVRRGGYVVVNSSLIKDVEYPSDVNVFEISATDMSNHLGNARGANLIMLGALMRASKMIEKNIFASELNKFFDDKGKNNPKNLECYLQGYEHAVKK